MSDKNQLPTPTSFSVSVKRNTQPNSKPFLERQHPPEQGISFQPVAKITQIPQQIHSLFNHKSKINQRTQMCQESEKILAEISDDYPQKGIYSSTDNTPINRIKIQPMFGPPQSKADQNLPSIYSQEQKLEKSKQFFNYLQRRMAKEYGIDLNSGLILQAQAAQEEKMNKKVDKFLPEIRQSRTFRNKDLEEAARDFLRQDFETGNKTESLPRKKISYRNSIADVLNKSLMRKVRHRSLEPISDQSNSKLYGSKTGKYESAFESLQKSRNHQLNDSLEKHKNGGTSEKLICTNSINYLPKKVSQKKFNQPAQSLTYSNRGKYQSMRSLHNSQQPTFKNESLRNLIEEFQD